MADVSKVLDFANRASQAEQYNKANAVTKDERNINDNGDEQSQDGDQENDDSEDTTTEKDNDKDK